MSKPETIIWGPFMPIKWIQDYLTSLTKKMEAGTALTEEEQTEYRIWSAFLVPIEPITLEKLLLGLVIAKYMQSEAGRKHLADIAKEYLGVVGKTMSALSNAGGSHPLAALIHGRITVTVYETLGLIPPMMARTLYSNMTTEIDAIIAKEYLSDVIGAIVPG